MRDGFGREIEYLRVSVTQSCNLNCIYCKPGNGSASHQCKTVLTPEEFQLIIKHMAELGIKKVRLTGGEPLVRQDICEIVSRIASVQGIKDISMTTNGINLAAMAPRLKQAGLMRLNISIDSLKEEKFKYITGGGSLNDVLTGIEKALEVGLGPIRTNTVLIKGVNDGEIDDFIRLAKDRAVDVRFIELMPVGKFGEENADKIVYNSDIIKERPYLVLCDEREGSQPARYYSIEGYKGKIGFISPMSHKFCGCCNRIRLTCDGKIKPCLGDNGEVDLIDTLRAYPDKLGEVVKKAIYCKPEGHNFDRSFTSDRDMSRIGG